jgi:hypothetical protein
VIRPAIEGWLIVDISRYVGRYGMLIYNGSVTAWRGLAPAPLEPRSACAAAVNARKSGCIHGHEFTPENTYSWPGKRRDCKTCRADRRGQARRQTLGVAA